MTVSAASAPGKVLLAGGYLILDRKHTGLVFGLNARIHVTVQDAADSAADLIVVQSPQFRDAIWRYRYSVAPDDGGIALAQTSETGLNPFVETALAYALSYITAVKTGTTVGACSITILADDDYYSQSTHNAKSDGFTDFGIALSDAHKTGLGSSAALVTALTAAVLQHFLPREVFSLENETSRLRLHNLAQASHCAAQGKVGSGFDVASAVYGSCMYRRFSPSILSGMGDAGPPGFAQRLKANVEDEALWDTEIVKSTVAIPRTLRLVMCDLDCGSKTPGMVKQVLAWRKECGEYANTLWSNLQSKNEALAAALVNASGSVNGHDRVRQSILDIRHLVRKMSQASDVPIEPPIISSLLNAVSKVDGVIGGVAPGAGGYDAVALLIENRPDVNARIQNFLDAWQKQSDDKADGIGKVQLLGVSGEMEGTRAEDSARYGSWIKQ